MARQLLWVGSMKRWLAVALMVTTMCSACGPMAVGTAVGGSLGVAVASLTHAAPERHLAELEILAGALLGLAVGLSVGVAEVPGVGDPYPKYVPPVDATCIVEGAC